MGVGVFFVGIREPAESMPDKITPNTLMSTLRGQLDLLKAMINSETATAVVYPIDYYDDGKLPDIINTSRVDGAAALEATRVVYRALSRQPDQHPSNVLRLPGVVMMRTPHVEVVDKINRVKDQLQQLIKQEKADGRARNAFCRQEFPGRVMLQVYRQIHSREKPVDQVTFDWDPVTRSSKKITRADAIERIEKRLQWRDQHLRQPGMIEAENIALEMLRLSPHDAEFRIMKKRAPYPRVTLYDSSDKDKVKHTFPASLPVIIPYSEGTEISDLYSLQTDEAHKRKSPSTKLETKSIFRPLDLYQVI